MDGRGSIARDEKIACLKTKPLGDDKFGLTANKQVKGD